MTKKPNTSIVIVALDIIFVHIYNFCKVICFIKFKIYANSMKYLKIIKHVKEIKNV